jgi:hypothetical protein
MIDLLNLLLPAVLIAIAAIGENLLALCPRFDAALWLAVFGGAS